MLKGVTEITKYIPVAEILDFSENDLVFSDDGEDITTKALSH